MRTLGKLLLVVALTAIGFSIHCEGEKGTAVERTDGEVRSVNRFDKEGRRHGLQQVFVRERLSSEWMVEHGTPIWRKEYNADGTLKEHWVEDGDYQLVPVE